VLIGEIANVASYLADLLARIGTIPQIWKALGGGFVEETTDGA
jgi:hypothetical protein